MKILYIGQGHGFDGPRKYYFIPQKLVNGFTRLGHHVVCINDRDIARHSNIFRSQSWGVAAMNDYVQKMFAAFMPDLVVLGHCRNLSNDTIAEMRARHPAICVIYRNVDPLHSPTNRRDIADRAGHVDHIFITTAGEPLRTFAKGRTRVSFMPNPVDSSIEDRRAFDNPAPEIDLLFLGSTLRDQSDHRAVTLERIKERAYEWRLYFGGTCFERKSVFGSAFFDILARARMGLCLNKTADYYLYASDRMSQYMGSGVMAFLQKDTGFEDIFGTDSFVSFSSDDDLLDKITFFHKKDDLRRDIARVGHEKIHRYFGTETVCQYILDVAFDKPLSQDYRWPTVIY